MADLAEHDTDQALSYLKKGTQLLKYGRKGKAKFCPFRLSHDESSLIWISSKGERCLKLALVSRIIPGQRTAVFRRYPHPEKEFASAVGNLVSTKPRHGGQKNVNKFMKDIIFVGRINYQSPRK